MGNIIEIKEPPANTDSEAIKSPTNVISEKIEEPEIRKKNSLHILKVIPDSLAEKEGLEVYFDYIIEWNDQKISQDSIKKFMDDLDKTINIKVYNSKYKSLRKIHLKKEKNVPIGLVVRLCDQHHALEHIFQIIHLYPNSPASKAGLKEGDLILGTHEEILISGEQIRELIKKYQRKPLHLFTYNIETNIFKETVMVPDDEWGGEGSFGCDIALIQPHKLFPTPQNKNPLL